MDCSLKELYETLGIDETHLSANQLPFHSQPPLDQLEVVDIDCEGKPFILISSAATAWLKMKKALEKELLRNRSNEVRGALSKKPARY